LLLGGDMLSDQVPRWETVGLTEEEHDRITEQLGRVPNDLELGLYGLMWSEHCSYKSSRAVLDQLPTEGEAVLQGPGENAGVVDIGEDVAVAFRIESHNHPSAIEPFQGAATGIGGILRDIFTMGARPVALLDSLRFGVLSNERVRYLMNGVVSGISFYGNCTGVPTVGGDVYFDDSYRENPLVNVMCVGLVPKERLITGQASGVGNPVFLVGAKTGRDGIHGASLLASREFEEGGEDMRPAVQVGDPFMEKLLIEATLEVLETGAVVGVNDLGAAGITSAASETASRAGSGIELDVALVPRREEGMTPYEVMLSESQERMLVIAKSGREHEVREVFDKWGLDSTVIGKVTGDGRLRVLEDGEVVADVPARGLTEEAPVYDREAVKPDYTHLHQLELDELSRPRDFDSLLRGLVASPNLASRDWVWHQYDHSVQDNTVVAPGGDAAVLRIKGTGKGIALTSDGNGRYVHLDPYRGAAIAVAEAARNVVCTGARPLAITNCLNWGNPERPETFWTFKEAVRGMGDACRALGTPVTGGNVSFYNETDGRAVYPTPVVGMVGLVEDMEHVTTIGWKEPEAVVCLVGHARDELGGTEYLKVVQGRTAGMPPELDLELERAVQETVLEAIQQGLVQSAHDVAEGGLAVALAECCFAAVEPVRGASLELEGGGIRPEALLFGESQSRIVISVKADDVDQVRAIAERQSAPFAVIGRTQAKPRLTIIVDGVRLVRVNTEQLEERWRDSLPWQLNQT